MIKRVNPQVDFIAIEHEVLAFWEEKNIFQKRRDANEGNTKWSFIDGPITANNPIIIFLSKGDSFFFHSIIKSF